MDKRKFCKRFMAWTAVVVAVVMLICGLCFGRVVEASLGEEIGKWVVMYFPICVIFETFAYTLSQFFYHGSRWDPTSEKYKKLHKNDKSDL